MEKTSRVKQKLLECNAIENILPFINKKLDLDISKNKEKNFSERPDIIFSNGTSSIGVEVVECHPSVRKNHKDNKASRKGLQDKICEDLRNSEILKIITKDKKLNIIINRFTLTKTVSKDGKKKNVLIEPQAFVNQIETILWKWYTEDILYRTENVKHLIILETKGRNIVQFDNISRRDSVNWSDIRYCINQKNQKVESYKKENKCGEYWLCIYLPFEESRQSNEIDYDEDLGGVSHFLELSPFSHIFITSIMPDDVNQIK